MGICCKGNCASGLIYVLTTHVEPVDQYLRTFSWNKVKYRADRPLPELADMLQKVWYIWPGSSIGDCVFAEMMG